MDELFSMHFQDIEKDDHDESSVAPPENLMSRCGACQTYMNYVSLPPHRLFCKTCDTAYNLPSGSAVTPCSGQYCPLDHFELVCVGKSRDKICPRCFNDPPFEDTFLVGREEECHAIVVLIPHVATVFFVRSCVVVRVLPMS